MESLGTSLSSTLKIEVGHFGLMHSSFVIMLFCPYIYPAFAHTYMKAGRGIYDCGHVMVTAARSARS